MIRVPQWAGYLTKACLKLTLLRALLTKIGVVDTSDLRWYQKSECDELEANIWILHHMINSIESWSKQRCSERTEFSLFFLFQHFVFSYPNIAPYCESKLSNLSRGLLPLPSLWHYRSKFGPTLPMYPRNLTQKPMNFNTKCSLSSTRTMPSTTANYLPAKPRPRFSKSWPGHAQAYPRQRDITRVATIWRQTLDSGATGSPRQCSSLHQATQHVPIWCVLTTKCSTPARPKPFGGGPYHGSSCRTPTSLFRPYYGCRFRGGYKTGIVLGRHSHDLKNYLSGGVRNIDKKAFMNVLESAIYHLHSLGLAHNDLNPTNVLVDDSEASGGMPVLIDFGSAGKIGSLLGTSRGTSGWIEGRIEDYGISRKEHDTFALEKMRLRLDNPTFDDD